MESEQDQRPSLKWKNDAVAAFRMVSFGIVSRPLTPQQTGWLVGEGVDTNRPATEQQELLGASLAQAQIDEKQAQIEVVEAVWSKTEREQLSADDKVFLLKKRIDLNTLADPLTEEQDSTILKLLKTLQAEKRKAQAELLAVVKNVQALEKRPRVSNGDTPEARRRARSPTPERSPQLPPMQGQGQAWKYTATVTNPLRTRDLRRKVFACAAESGACFGSLAYAESIPDGTPYDSLLICELFFRWGAAADNFDTKLRHLVQVTYNSDLIAHQCPRVEQVCRVLDFNEKVNPNSYKAAPPSPDRTDGLSVVEPAASEASTSLRLDPEVIAQEAISDPLMSVPGCPFQWCHILPETERENTLNRLVLDSLLRGYYDHGQLSVYCRDEDVPLYDEDSPQEVKLQIIFADSGIASRCAALREGHVRLGPRQFEVTIAKPKARSFVQYVNHRHARNVEEQTLLAETAETLMLPTGSSEGDLNELEAYNHEHTRETKGSAPGLDWSCECHNEPRASTKHQYKCVVEGCEAKLCVACRVDGK